MLIAIDGPAASGKGTVAKMIAKHFGLKHLDTGRLYRLVGWELLQRTEAENTEYKLSDGDELAIQIATNLDVSNINLPELETEKVGLAASMISAIPGVRAALFEFQRKVARDEQGAVLDGRDIGTVIAPEADFKFFITADAKVRAERRYKQLTAAGKNVTEQDILNDINARDHRDKNRVVAPLIPAKDAVLIDTSDMSISEVFERIKYLINKSL